jgi:hypothetical protein
MPEYDALFEVPATVTLLIRVTAENQQLGIVEAYDQLQNIKLESHEISSLALDQANNISIQQAGPTSGGIAKNVAPLIQEKNASFLNKKGEFRVFVSDDASADLNSTLHFTGSYIDAMQIANSIKCSSSRHGSSTLVDLTDVVHLETKSTRGGWEVHMGGEGDSDVLQTSWLSSLEQAKAELLQLSESTPDKDLSIYDFTNRLVGPVFYLKVSNG